MATLYRSGLHAPWAYISRSEPNDLSPLYMVVRAARRLLKDGRQVDLPQDYDLEVLDRIAWLTGEYGVRVNVSARQADEVNQIARTLEQQHQDVLTLAEREAIALLRRAVEAS
jgi:hypothetical protein